MKIKWKRYDQEDVDITTYTAKVPGGTLVAVVSCGYREGQPSITFVPDVEE